jgi:hypothetical protein
MIRTKPGWTGVVVGDPVTFYGRSGEVLLPETMTIAIDSYDRPLLLDFVWSPPAWAMVLAGIRGGTGAHGEPLGLPTGITRSVAPRQLVAEVMRYIGRQVPEGASGELLEELNLARDPRHPWPWAEYQRLIENLPPISKSAAEALARGRDKSQQSVAEMRHRAATAARELMGQGVTGRQLYQRVADELHVGRTTAYTYLRDAGIIGKGKRR